MGLCRSQLYNFSIITTESCRTIHHPRTQSKSTIVIDEALAGQETANFGEFNCSLSHVHIRQLKGSNLTQNVFAMHALLIEFPLMTKAGIRLEVLLNATTRRDEQGDVIGVVGESSICTTYPC
jgi:hypothetical protein